MKEIVRVTIKGFSGYGPYDEGYEDKVIITQDFISYEYVPNVESETNPKRKWRYSTNSPIFKLSFAKISELIEEALNAEIEGFCTDIGGIEFTLMYADKSKKRKHYWLPGDYFSEIIHRVKELVPQTEYTPAVLLTEEDFDDE